MLVVHSNHHQCGPDYAYQRTLNYAGDGLYVDTPNATFFKQQFTGAGFSESAMIAEGKRIAEVYRVTYGVDVASYITDDNVYLAPDVTIPGGIKFTYVTINESLNFNLVSATNGAKMRFINKPVNAVWYTLQFSQDYTSTGTYSGTVTAGFEVIDGNYLIFTGTPNYQFFGQNNFIFVKFVCVPTKLYFPGYGPFLPFNCTLTHEDWGQGELKGLFVVNTVTGLVGGRETLTWGCSA